MSESGNYENFRHNLSPYDQKLRSDKLAREYQIAVEYMHVIRERLSDCVRTETVNQFTACKDLREKYFALCADRYHGMLVPPGEEPVNRQIPGVKKN